MSWVCGDCYMPFGDAKPGVGDRCTHCGCEPVCFEHDATRDEGCAHWEAEETR